MNLKKNPLSIVLALLLVLGLANVALAGDDDHEEKHRIVLERLGNLKIGELGIGELEAGENIFHLAHGGAGEFRAHLFGSGGGFLGVQTNELTPELRTHFGVPEDVGVMVGKVLDDTAAARAGIQVGDIITRVNGEDVDSAWDLKRYISALGKDEEALIELWRDGAVETITAAVEHRERQIPRAFMMHPGCDEGEDCEGNFNIELLCDEGDNCASKTMIRCVNGDCECSRDGEDTDCESLEGYELHKKHHE